MSERQDKTIVCSDCNTEFIWTAGEQEFYAINNLADPKRCPDCRKARKAARKQQNQ
jgi:hypothetical protein